MACHACMQIAFAGLSHVYKCYFSDGEHEGEVAAAKILTTGYSHTGPKVCHQYHISSSASPM